MSHISSYDAKRGIIDQSDDNDASYFISVLDKILKNLNLQKKKNKIKNKIKIKHLSNKCPTTIRLRLTNIDSHRLARYK